jgi:hypothetical protein
MENFALSTPSDRKVLHFYFAISLPKDHRTNELKD